MQNLTKELSFYLLISLFIVAPFYYQSNIGGLGLILPFNIAIWFIGILFIAFVTFYFIKNCHVIFTRYFAYCLIFPIILIVEGFFYNDNLQPVVWLFRQLFILGGLFFLFCLFQLKLTTAQIEKVLYYVVFSSFLHCLIGVAQINEIVSLSDWLPMSRYSLPMGIFQQVNLQATYLTSGVLISLFLISRPSFSSSTLWTKVFLILTIGLSVYIVLFTESRAGAISLILGTIVMISSRFKQLLRHKLVLVMIVIVTCIAVFPSQDKVMHTQQKVVKITSDGNQSARSTMYGTTIDLIKKKPLFGYGIGSFPSVWAEQSIIFTSNHPDATASHVMTNHPHNEISLWMVEGGAVAVLGIMVIILVIAVALYRCGYSRGGAYAALLLPISLHTQVELPFYGSAVHWFLWLFFIYMVFRHQLKIYSLSLSSTARLLVRLLTVIMTILGLSFLVHASNAQKEIYDYKFNGGGDMKVPLMNPYFNAMAERITMQNMLYSSIENEELSTVPVFIEWAEKEIKAYPVQGMFVLLIDAYGSMGEKFNQCRIAKRGALIYSEHKYFLKTLKGCELN